MHEPITCIHMHFFAPVHMLDTTTTLHNATDVPPWQRRDWAAQVPWRTASTTDNDGEASLRLALFQS